MTTLQKHLVFLPLFCLAYIAVAGGGVMLLWNWLMPEIFGLPTLCFGQAAGLLLLCKLLLSPPWHRHHGHGHGCATGKLRQRWESMTPEERERIINQHGLR